MISLESLLREGRVHLFNATEKEIDRVLSIAGRDLDEAGRRQDSSLDWTFSIAYNAVLQSCRAFMFNEGYRSASAEAHKTTFQFMRLVVPEAMQLNID
jgi:hypothetical protein